MDYILELKHKLRCVKFFINYLQYKLDHKLPFTRKEEDLLSLIDEKYYVIEEMENYLYGKEE